MANTATEAIREREQVDPANELCGNCALYEWPDNYDRHNGSCPYQDAEENPSVSQYFVKGNLHALTGGCPVFCRVRM